MGNDSVVVPFYLFVCFFQSREEEMGDRVWQVQKQLEELQARTQDTSEVQIMLTHCSSLAKHLL